MTHALIGAVALLHGLNAAWMWSRPLSWYETVPGVALMGPFNVHFVRDVALVYAVSAAALLWGVRRRDGTALLFGAAWPMLHALFHGWIWIHRGTPVDVVAAANLFGIQLPAWAVAFAALRLRSEARAR